MDSKTLTILAIVIVCAMLFPIAIGIIGGIFGAIGGVIGGIFGLIAGIFGAIFGVIGAILGAIFGWADYGCWGSFNFFDGDVFAAIALVVVIVLIARSRNDRPAAKQ
jgi:MFS family permease